MHSFDLSFEDFFVPEANVVGGEAGLGQGFYYTMAGMVGGRMQTAARACGVMRAPCARPSATARTARCSARRWSSFADAGQARAHGRAAGGVPSARVPVAALVDQGKGAWKRAW